MQSRQDAAHDRTTNPITRHLPTAARVVIGVLFLVTGLNIFFNFLPQPTTPLPEGAVAFASAMMKSGYMMRLIGVTQAIGGVLLLTNRFVPLALALIAPVIVNIFAFHIFLEPSGIPVASLLAALELYLVWTYRQSFTPMLAMRATPNRTGAKVVVP